MPRRLSLSPPTTDDIALHSQWMVALEQNPEFIPGLHHYCDRWCERCSMTERCRSHQLEHARQSVLLAARLNPAQKTHWLQLGRQLALQLQRLDRASRAAPAPEGNASPPLPVSPEAAALLHQAAAYRQHARTLLLRLPKVLADVQRGWETPSPWRTADHRQHLAGLRDALEVAEWFVFFIEAKLQRAFTARGEEAAAPSADDKSDADGSAKVALLAIDRSVQAWTTLRVDCEREADGILDLLVELEQLRQGVEDAFPYARAFQRPGFD